MPEPLESLSLENSPTTEQSQPLDQATVPLFEEAAKKTPPDSDSSTSKKTDPSVLMTIEDTKQAIGEEILSVLAEKFNGKLSEVRPVDSKDVLF